MIQGNYLFKFKITRFSCIPIIEYLPTKRVTDIEMFKSQKLYYGIS